MSNIVSQTLLTALIIFYCIWWYKYQGVKKISLKDSKLDDRHDSLKPNHEPPPKHHHRPPPKHQHVPPPKPNHKHDLIEKQLKMSTFINNYLPTIICILLVVITFIYPYNKFISIIFLFLITMITIFLRPRNINEAYPASIGAIIIIVSGAVFTTDLIDITYKISGASLTIIATIVMAITLESFGFFHWVASKLSQLTKGSGIKLYWYIQLLSFLMTLLFNNDGSILITTPILILVLKNFNLTPKEQIPYLLSSGIICTASSAPIGVSNITNLIALNIVNMTLYMHTAMMFVPCTIGLAFLSYLMFRALRKKIPTKLHVKVSDLENNFFETNFASVRGKSVFDTPKKRTKFMVKVLGFVFFIRCLLFVESYFHIPLEVGAIFGSVVLLCWRWYYLRISPKDIVKKIPWYILIFAFSMYVIIYGLNNIGLIDQIVKICEPLVNQNLFNASLIMGTLVSILSNIFNNHPALMLGTIALTDMGLNPITLKTIYLANIIGSDIGSLILPIGTLASLMWFYILKNNNIKVTWMEYISLTIKVIPITVLVTLILLFAWVSLIFT